MEEKEQVSYVPIDESQDRGVNLQEYLLVLLKRRWMILIILVLSIVGTTLYSFRQTPMYRSTATLYIDLPGFSFLSDLSQISYWQGYNTFFNTQYKLLESKALTTRVVERLGLVPAYLKADGIPERPAKTSTAKLSEKESGEVIERLLEMLKIEPVRDTNLTRITFNTPNPKLSMILANTWADEYREYSISSKFEITQQAESLLQGQVNALQNEIREKEKTLQNYSLEKQVIKLQGEKSMSEDKLRSLNSASSEATNDTVSKEVRYRDIQHRPKASIPEVVSNPEVAQIRAELSKAESEYRDKLKIYKPEYPEMARIRGQIDQLKKNLEQETDRAFGKAVASARADFLEAKEKEAALLRQIESAKRETVEGYRKEFDYDRLKLEIENKKELLASITQRLNETGVSAQVQEKKATLIRVVDYAEAPDAPYTPNIGRNVMFSILFGLLTGIALSFAIEYLDRSLKTPDDVERYTQLPILGVVPQHVMEEPNGNKPQMLALARKEKHYPARVDLHAMSDPHSITSEAVKTVRTALLLSFPGDPPRSILITSSRPGEGKTFIACNLAIALAQLNKKVVIVDADLRNPRIHRVWDMENNGGLTQFLTSHLHAGDVTRSTPEEGVSIITSGPRTPRPAELLSSDRFVQLLKELEQHYDHIVVDSPPLLPVTDSVILAAKCSAVLLVVRGGETPRDTVQEAKKKLAKSDPMIAGVVLNCINLSDPYYYYSYYSYYREYYGERDKGTKAIKSKSSRS